MRVEDGITNATIGVFFDHDRVKPKAHQRSIRASYDSAQTTTQNYRHWAAADDLSPDASLAPHVRRTLRNRSRFELLRNSSIGRGMVQTYAQDTIGTSINLVMGLKNEAENLQVQAVMGEWIEAINLVERLLTAKVSKTIDGEMLFRLVTNPRLDCEINLDLLCLEADHLGSPFAYNNLTPNYVDGVHLDRLKNAASYDLLKEHPGSPYATMYGEFDNYDASQVIHWFRADRCGQHRGAPECAAALPLFAYRRRYQLAVIAAAETAANRAQVLETDLDPEDIAEDSELAAAVADFTRESMLNSVHLDRNDATVLPSGFRLNQMRAEQPTTTFAMFDRAIVMELSRCLSMPYETVAGDHSKLSYSGGILSRSNYERGLLVERSVIRRKILDVLFSNFMHEAALTNGVLPSTLSDRILDIVRRVGTTAIARKIPHEWHFDGFSQPDPKKAADAAGINLRNGLTNRAAELAKKGIDIDAHDRIAAKSFGFGEDVDAYRQAVMQAIFANGNPPADSTLTEIADQVAEIDQIRVEDVLGVGA